MASIASCLLFVAASLGQTVISDDAHNSSVARNSNFGTNPALTVSDSNNAYLKFKVAAVLPAGTAGSKISKSTIKLFVDKVGRPVSSSTTLSGRTASINSDLSSI